MAAGEVGSHCFWHTALLSTPGPHPVRGLGTGARLPSLSFPIRKRPGGAARCADASIGSGFETRSQEGQRSSPGQLLPPLPHRPFQGHFQAREGHEKARQGRTGPAPVRRHCAKHAAWPLQAPGRPQRLHAGPGPGLTAPGLSVPVCRMGPQLPTSEKAQGMPAVRAARRPAR